MAASHTACYSNCIKLVPSAGSRYQRIGVIHLLVRCQKDVTKLSSVVFRFLSVLWFCVFSFSPVSLYCVLLYYAPCNTLGIVTERAFVTVSV